MVYSISATSVYAPRVSLSLPPPLHETLQDQERGLAQDHIKLLLVLVHMEFCVCKSEVSLPPSPVGLLPLSSAVL